MGGGKTPSVPETPSPTAMPVPTDVNPIATEGQRANKISQLKRGMLSTIKTSPAGVTGTGADLSNPQTTEKKTLGGS
jgi:hypothetical protein